MVIEALYVVCNTLVVVNMKRYLHMSNNTDMYKRHCACVSIEITTFRANYRCWKCIGILIDMNIYFDN